MEVEAAGSETLVRKPEAVVKRRRGKGYSFQVKLENVKFAFDEKSASALELDPEMSAVERAERDLRERVLSPVRFAESDGTRHQVLEWDPTPVAYSGFMGCVTHSMRCRWPVPVHDPIVSASLPARPSFHLDRSPERRSRLIAHSYRWKAKGRGATHGSGPLSRLSSMQAVRLHLTPA
jgi:hypothetical protein